jgi:hypothetical protein
VLPIEQEILAALRRKDVWSRFAEQLPPEFFPSQEARQVRRAMATLHQDNTRGVLPKSWIRRLAGQDIPEPLSARPCEELILRELLKSRLLQWQRWTSADLEEGEMPDLENVKRDIQELEQLTQVGVSENGYAPLLASDVVRRKVWEERGTIPTFLHRDLDDYLGGGTGRGQLCLLQAPAKHGKTTLLLTIAYRAAQRGLHTLFVSCENYLDQIAERLEQVHSVAKRTRGKQFPRHFHVDYRYGLTVRDLEGMICTLPKVDVVIIDYADNMRAQNVQGIDFVWTINELYDGMRDIANRHEAVVWTATQEKDPEHPSQTSSRERTYGSDKKFQKCDLFLGCIAKPRTNSLSIKVLARRGRGKMGKVFQSVFDQDTAELKELREIRR